jgi:Mrp family chromosome partitioning ATPase
MQRLLEKVSAKFDYIFLDSAPIMPVSDAMALSTMVDGVLVVVSAQTSKHAVFEAYARLSHVNDVNKKILGVILNKLDVTSPDFLYHHRYSYRYSYHYYTSEDREGSESS